jgi:hypothetical protein
MSKIDPIKKKLLRPSVRPNLGWYLIGYEMIVVRKMYLD